MRKLISAVLAGAMVASMAVMASAVKTVSNANNAIVTATATLYTAAGAPVVGYQNQPLHVKFETVDANANTIKPGSDIYVQLPTDDLIDEDYFKSKTDKGDNNAKMIEKISLVEKDEDFEAGGGRAGRTALIKIDVKDDLTADEFKFTPSVKFTAKEDAQTDGVQIGGQAVQDDYYLIIDITAWMGNVQRDGDEDWDAGTGGYIAKPTKDDDNEIIWHNENNDIARLTFQADSDVAKYYPKLSTKWVDSTYSEVIGNADGFVLEFVGNPAISSTSRATLEIYNPYINDDDEYEVAVEDLRVYLADADGVLEDITASCTLGTNDDDDEVITLRTRQLGTYVVTDGTAIVDDVVVDDTDAVEEPSKTNPGTGF